MHADWRPDITKEGNILVSGIVSEEFGISASDSLELYYYDGLLKQVMRMANGKRNGAHIEFNDNGSLYFTGNVLNNKSDGIFRGYDEQGKLESIAILVGGTKILEYSGRQLDSLLNPLARK